MIINKIDVTDNYTKFCNIEGLEYRTTAEEIDDLYLEIVNICFNRYIGEDFGSIVEHIANNIIIHENEDDEDSLSDIGYNMVYANWDIIEGIANSIKYYGNGMFRSGSYNDVITIELSNSKSGTDLIFHTSNALFNSSIFDNVDNEEPSMVIELEQEFIIFKTYFGILLDGQYSHNSSSLHNNDYYPMFVGIVELLLTYDSVDISFGYVDITNSLDQLFKELIEIIAPEDEGMLSKFFLESPSYINKLISYLKIKTGGNYDLVSWGVIGEKVLIGLSKRR